jgi:hypothetical protein
MGRIYQQKHVLRDKVCKQPILDASGDVQRVLRSRHWWIRYRDANGKVIDESSEL